jgi:REP element-mobilizing transposase RayT
MKHTRVSLRVHCIFSTKDRRPAIPEGLQARAWAFMGGIARNLGSTAIAVGGMADHVHILLLLSPTMALAEAVQKIKANSSRWLREQTGKPFHWQEGYAAFSVSISHTDATVAYIRNQKKHHERRGFDEELAAILKKHRMEE